MELCTNNWLCVLIPIIVVLAIWDIVWKLIGLWKAGRNNELGWFIAIALINSIGILPIIYILIQRKKNKEN
jgi:predicted Co/Zn/Cd cation transporter (cation efflux family)